jgi:FkbM family methyltransferase
MKLLNRCIDGALRFRRKAAEVVGVDRYSWPARHELDRRLAADLGAGGFFIEAGANDGFAQSNTYGLERMKGWRGILIEPIPALGARCRRERPRSVVVQAALVAPDYEGEEIEMQFAGLMSVSAHAFDDARTRQRHVEVGMQQHGVEGTYAIKVPARTLSGIIDDVGGRREIDLLSLDVEGSEAVALAGLDLHRHAPRAMLIEVRPEVRAEIVGSLAERYGPPQVWFDGGSHEDLFFVRR